MRGGKRWQVVRWNIGVIQQKEEGNAGRCSGMREETAGCEGGGDAWDGNELLVEMGLRQPTASDVGSKVNGKPRMINLNKA